MKNQNKHRSRVILFLSLLVVLLSACNLPLGQAISPTPIPIADMLINHDNRYAATPTPFQPIFNTQGAISSQVPTNESQPDIENTPDPTTTPLPKLIKPAGQVNILLLGSDWRSGSGYRTDVILLLSLNTETGTATLVSFPRDLYVNIPGIGMERINAAQEYGGFPLTKATFMSSFGIDVDYYMITNFSGFVNIVDTLGGINVFASKELYDLCALPQAVDDYCYVPYGNNLMNGETALWYVRSRHSSSDFDRTRRAQEVLIAIFQKSMGLNALSRGSELYDLFRNSVDTNLTVGKVLELLPLAGKIYSDPSLIRRFAIGSSEVYNYVVPTTGAMVLIPDDTLVNQLLKQALE